MYLKHSSAEVLMNRENVDTILELLKEFQVVIPIIQRDYAQGRNDDIARLVRKNLIRDMKLSLSDENTKLDLNFVYGKVEDKKFIPVDGQQRLTTLFLLHIFAYRSDDSMTELLERFTYHTRTTSRDFFEKIVEHRFTVFNSSNTPQKEIKDLPWFISSWQHDPTIQSALTMLDAIKEEFDDLEELASKLSCKELKPITFHFLDMENLGMEDSLYIKLNARGRPLSDFENFKARLLGRLEKILPNLLEEYEINFDTKWADIFCK